MRECIDRVVQVGGDRLAVWHWRAVDDRLSHGRRRPCVVMAPAFACTRDCGLPRFASRLAAAGLDVLLFD